MLTPEELEKEWTAQSAISDYTNWLQAQVIKLRRQIADKIKQRAAACAQIEKSERRADAAEAEVARLREVLQEMRPHIALLRNVTAFTILEKALAKEGK